MVVKTKPLARGVMDLKFKSPLWDSCHALYYFVNVPWNVQRRARCFKLVTICNAVVTSYQRPDCYNASLKFVKTIRSQFRILSLLMLMYSRVDVGSFNWTFSIRNQEYR
jgi:hypothetical protein